MKIFHCDHCHQIVYFENHSCTNCGSLLGFCPDLRAHFAFEAAGDGRWRNLGFKSENRYYRQCLNYSREDVCNWMIPEGSPENYCQSCGLNQTIPDISNPDYKHYWHQLEIAKRRLVYSLLRLGLPVCNKNEDPENGLAFAFLAGHRMYYRERKPVMTGHDKGLITINISEANDAVREKMRLNMKERYRTLLGHFRHEVGHYYWFRLLSSPELLEKFRGLFGDERADYTASLRNYYDQREQGANWQFNYISQYASAHPWEDWAETWAHYLHMTDTLETANSWGISLNPVQGHPQSSQTSGVPVIAGVEDFDQMLNAWVWVTCALNSLNRSMGMKDVYPFVLSSGVVDKLRYVHSIIRESGGF